MRKTVFLVGLLALMVTFLTIAAGTAQVPGQGSDGKFCPAITAGSAALVMASPTAQGPTEYHGNTRTKIFHGPSCRYYNCARCTKVFKTRHEAIDAGYRPCKVCRP